MLGNAIGNDDESLELTRSSTVFHALERLFGADKLPSHLVLHILGSDHREGTTPEETRSVFEGLFRRAGQEKHVRYLDLLFCGPNIAPHLHDTRHSFTHHHASTEDGCNHYVADTCTTADTGLRAEGQQSPTVTTLGTRTSCSGSQTRSSSSPSPEAEQALVVTLSYNSGLYHDISGMFPAPDALFLFNAGLWGYDDWEPTLKQVLGYDARTRGAYKDATNGCEANRSAGTPRPAMVVTSYCPEEASDDMETIERVLLGTSADAACIEAEHDEFHQLEWLWKPEINPHRSLVPRRTECGVEGRVLFENQSWQALRRSCGRSPPATGC